MNEASNYDSTSIPEYESDDVVRLLRAAGYSGPWPDSPQVDGLPWRDVRAKIINHPAVQAILKVAQYPPPNLAGPICPADRNSTWLRSKYPTTDRRRAILYGETGPVAYNSESGGPTSGSIWTFYLDQVVWSLLVALFDQLRRGDLIAEEDHGNGGQLFGSPAAESRYWCDPRMILDLATGGFRAKPRPGEPAPEPGWLRSYKSLCLRGRPKVRQDGASKRPGRPPKLIWENVLAKLRARLEDDGAPARGDGGQAELERFVAEQFHPDARPAESTIRSKVAGEIAAYRDRVSRGQ